jgi:hypothetical protein
MDTAQIMEVLLADFTVGITPLSSSNSRTLDSRTLEPSTLELLYSLTGYSLRLTRRILLLTRRILRLSFSRTLVFVDSALSALVHSLSNSRTVGPTVAIGLTE